MLLVRRSRESVYGSQFAQSVADEIPEPEPVPEQVRPAGTGVEDGELAALLAGTGPEPVDEADEVPVSAVSNGHHPAVSAFADEIAAGTVPGIREIRRRIHVGQPRATAVQQRIRTLAEEVH